MEEQTHFQNVSLERGGRDVVTRIDSKYWVDDVTYYSEIFSNISNISEI